MDYVSPTVGQVTMTLVLFFTAYNSSVLARHPVVDVLANVVVLVTAVVLLVQAYGAYQVWTKGTESGFEG